MNKRLPELDGLRIVAAGLVVMSHLITSPGTGIPVQLNFLFDGGIAVLIFFVLSGFVITRMLMREMEHTGTISMGQFYLRRSLRIWPAFYAYIIVVIILIALHFAAAPPIQIIFAAAHLWNYAQATTNFDTTNQGFTIFGHFWSLALEEQFYWTWPIALLLVRKHINRLLCAIIIAMPLLRIVSYLLFPAQRGNLNFMFHTGLDPIAMGALLALAEARLMPRVQNLSPWLFYGNIVFLLVACPLLGQVLHGFWTITYGRTFEAGSAGLLIFALAHGPETIVARFLRTAPMQFVSAVLPPPCMGDAQRGVCAA